MTEAVALNGVTKRYGAIVAVRDLDLVLRAGELGALVGHNGAGKTTQIKMMLGLARPSAGHVELLDGDPAADGFALRRHVGYLPESVSFHLALTGRETLAFYARLKGVDRRRLDPAFETVGLGGAARVVGPYSKGMRQRLALAQALLGHPRLLLLDEPISGLDPALRRDFYAIVADLDALPALHGPGALLQVASEVNPEPVADPEPVRSEVERHFPAHRIDFVGHVPSILNPPSVPKRRGVPEIEAV